jgi:hypothetical protein
MASMVARGTWQSLNTTLREQLRRLNRVAQVRMASLESNSTIPDVPKAPFEESGWKILTTGSGFQSAMC